MKAAIGDWIEFVHGTTVDERSLRRLGVVDSIGLECYGVWVNGSFLRVEAAQVREVRGAQPTKAAVLHEGDPAPLPSKPSDRRRAHAS